MQADEAASLPSPPLPTPACGPTEDQMPQRPATLPGAHLLQRYLCHIYCKAVHAAIQCMHLLCSLFTCTVKSMSIVLQ